VIAGKAIPADGRPACFGHVQTYDTKPKRRLFEVLRSQGMAANQQVTFLTDGGEDIRDLPCYLNAQAEHLLDWFHLMMRITVMANITEPCPGAGPNAPAVREFDSYIRANAERIRNYGNASVLARPSSPRSANPRSTRSSASAWS
jgi:hypothetical protein